MKKDIDWLNHSLEFLVVLIGIVIAFQLNKCSDNQSKSALLSDHLKYIEIECQENQESLTQYIEHVTVQISNCDSLLAEISGTKNIEKIRAFATKLLDMRHVNLGKDSYRVLVESGDIRYLEDYEKKRKIISLYNSFDDIDKINRSNQNLYDNHFYPYLKENFDLVNWNFVEVKSEEDQKKYYSPEFANTVSTYKFLLAAKLRTYKLEKEMIQEYLGK